MDEEKLRLLNYQSNQICTIENLEGLPNLIFLDLFELRRPPVQSRRVIIRIYALFTPVVIGAGTTTGLSKSPDSTTCKGCAC